MIALAIPAFNRPELLSDLLSSLDQRQISSMYISIDGPTSSYQEENLACVQVALEFSLSASVPVWVLHCDRNVGCAANVLGVVDFMFASEEIGAVIEDDCLPSADFLPWAEECLALYSHDADLWAVCGTQFAPAQHINGTQVRASYPLMWGWATSQSKWESVRKSITRVIQVGNVPSGLTHLGITEKKYWEAGLRRSARGYLDTWDIAVTVAAMSKRLKVVLPRTSLVSNVGDGLTATHTSAESTWLRQKMLSMSYPLVEADENSSLAVDAWLRKNFFRISTRHIYSTLVTRLMDWLFPRRLIREPLSNRVLEWNASYRIIVGPS